MFLYVAIDLTFFTYFQVQLTACGLSQAYSSTVWAAGVCVKITSAARTASSAEAQTCNVTSYHIIASKCFINRYRIYKNLFAFY